MTTVTFETAVFIEAVRRAASLAPTKGAAFDKAAGIIIEIIPDDGDAVFRCTDQQTFVTRWVKALSIESSEPETTWRVPSGPFSGVAEKLRPTGNVSLTQTGKTLTLIAGRTKAEFSLMDSSGYPKWDVFEEENLATVENLGVALRAVSWAKADGGDGVMDGVHLSGEYAIATNRYRVCRYPLMIKDMPEGGITLSAPSVKTLSEFKGDVKFGTNGHQAFFMPDDDTQVRVVLYGEPFPFPKRVYELEYTDQIVVQPSELMRMIGLTDVISQSDRSIPSLRFWIGKGTIAALARSDEIGAIRDIIDIPGQANHDRVEIKINPKYLALALDNGEGTSVTLRYNSGIKYINLGEKSPDRIRCVLRFDKLNGYNAWVIPITG